MPTRTCHRLVLLFAALAPATACTPDPASTPTPPRTADSLGIRIVAYDHTPASTAPFRLAPQPRYRHGADPGDYHFQGIGPGRLLPDGSAVVYDVWNTELVALSPDGKGHRVLAAQGEGPGEISYITAILALGRDSLLVTDPGLARATLFVGDSVARITPLPRTARLGAEGTAPSGALLLATSYAPFSDDDEWRPGHMARLDMETGALDTVASYDLMPRIPAGLQLEPIPAVGEITVASGHFVQTRSDTPELTWRRTDGTVTQIVRWQAEPAPLTDAWLAPIQTELSGEVRMHSPDLSEARIAEVVRSYMAIYRASVGRPMPLFSNPFADALGRVWLPSYKPGGEIHDVPPYTVIAPGGEWLGRVDAPPGFRILDVAAGLVLGVERDEMDVVSVVVYELVGGSGAGH